MTQNNDQTVRTVKVAESMKVMRLVKNGPLLPIFHNFDISFPISTIECKILKKYTFAKMQHMISQNRVINNF